MRKRQKNWLFLAFLVLAIPVGAQEAAATKQSSQPAVPATNAAQKAAPSTDPNYVIGPQDVLDISVWKEPEVSRVVPVRPDGRISLPLLNDVQAAGLTPAALAAQLTEGLKKYVTNPQVTVIVTAITPIMTPNMVRNARSLCSLSISSATSTL